MGFKLTPAIPSISRSQRSCDWLGWTISRVTIGDLGEIRGRQSSSRHGGSETAGEGDENYIISLTLLGPGASLQIRLL